MRIILTIEPFQKHEGNTFPLLARFCCVKIHLTLEFIVRKSKSFSETINKHIVVCPQWKLTKSQFNFSKLNCK